VFENRLLWRIFWPERDEVTGEWRKLHNEELNDLYSSPNMVWVIKSRRMRWAGHVVRMGDRRGVYRVLVGKLERKRQLGDPGVDGSSGSGMWGCELDRTESGYGQVTGICECGNEPSGFIKFGEFLD